MGAWFPAPSHPFPTIPPRRSTRGGIRERPAFILPPTTAYSSDGFKDLETMHPALAKTKVVVVPIILQDIVYEILDYLAADSHFRELLQTCALVSKSWVQPCQRHLFRTIDFTSRNMETWRKVFPAPKEGPAHLVRGLRIWTGGRNCFPEKFSEYASWFPNTEKICVVCDGMTPPPPRCQYLCL